MAILGYTPEMGQAKPQAQGEITLSHYGKHYFIKTPLTLPAGRSIEFLGTLSSDRLVKTSAAHAKDGWNEYKVTVKAMDRLKEQYDFSLEMLLD